MTTTASSCAVKPELSAPRTPVRVNGVTIAHADIAAETQHHPAARPYDAWLAAARALVIRQLLVQEADRLHIVADAGLDEDGRRETDEEARVRVLIQQQAPSLPVTEENCRRYYEHNIDRFRSPDIFAVAHILIPHGADAATENAARKRVLSIIETLKASPEKFAHLAAEHSACPSASMGGELGQIGPGQTVPEFEKALATMTPGVVHPLPIESRFGFHIVRLDQAIAGDRIPFEAVRGRIESFLQRHAERTGWMRFVGQLAERATIEGVKFAHEAMNKAH